jgi:hypothetical protein
LQTIPGSDFYNFHGLFLVSKVFDWFGENWGGKEDKVAFVRKYSPPELAAEIDQLGDK